MNTKFGWLTYLRHYQGDSGFRSRNPMYDESDATLGGLAFEGPYGREHLPVMTYRWSNGMPEEFPASWALPESDIMRALEYFVQHEGRRAPFVQWHDDAVAEPSSEITQPTEKGEFTVVPQTASEMKVEVIREVRFLTGLGLKRKILPRARQRSQGGRGRNEAEKITATLEKVGPRSRSIVLRE